MAEEALLTINPQRGQEQMLDAEAQELVEVQSINTAVVPIIPTSVQGQVES